MHIKPINLWLAHLRPSKIKSCLWRIGMAVLLSTPVLATAAPSAAEALQGHWRLEQAGHAENGQLVAHDFNQCRLLRTYTLRADGYAIYSSAEGEEGACRVNPSTQHLC